MQNDVMFGILLTLLQKKRTTAKELSLKYELSVRSIFRYIDALNQSGVPIVSYPGKSGGFGLVENFTFEKTFFTQEEFSKLVNSVKSYSSVLGDSHTKMLVDKLLSLSCKPVENYFLQAEHMFIDTPMSVGFKGKVSALEKSIFSCLLIRLTYNSRKAEVTKREVEPHAFVLREGLWYLYAFCHLRQQFRLFKISRITEIVLTEKTFERKDVSSPKKTEDSNSDQIFLDITFLLNQQARLDMEEWIGIENVVATGKEFVAFAKLPFDQELLSKILSFGKNLKVLSPISLRNTVKDTISSMQKVYIDDDSF